MTQPSPADRILDAAEKHFAEQGFAGARINAIADEAGVNKAMLYYYFGNKEALHQAVVERVANQIVLMGERVLSDEALSPPERVESFIGGYRNILLAHPNLPRIVLRSMVSGDTSALAVIAPRIRPIAVRFVETLNGGQADGSLNDDLDPMLTMLTLVAPIIIFANGREFIEMVFDLDPAQTRAAFDKTHRSLLMNGLLARTPNPEDR